uniref:Uncharacterized protein n=1 Tax=Homalodisca liturata TaxID=320908 RepID=A0A1B6HGH9_9HEMI
MYQLFVVIGLAAVSAALPDVLSPVPKIAPEGLAYLPVDETVSEIQYGETNQMRYQTIIDLAKKNLRAVELLKLIIDAFKICICKNSESAEREFAHEIASLIPIGWLEKLAEQSIFSLVGAVHNVCQTFI